MSHMRVLFSTTAGAGHFGPMVPVARACVEAGHEVAVAAPASFAASVHGVDLTHLPFPDAPPEQMGAVFGRLGALPLEEADRIVVADVFGRLDARAALPVLLETMQSWRPDVVVSDPCEFGSIVAAARLGLPAAQSAIGMGDYLTTISDWFDEPVRELEEIAGVPSPRGAELVLSAPTLTSVPPSLDGAATGPERPERVRFRSELASTGPALPGEWGDPDTPLVYVTFGSVAAAQPAFRGLYPAVLEVLAALPVRVLMTTGEAFDLAQLGSVPPNAWVLPWWPQEAAMREAALAVGHGGFGTTMTTLAAGVPQVVLPLFSFDQRLNAAQVEEVGAGVQRLGGPNAVEQVAQAVTEVLEEPRYAERASAVAAEIAGLPDVSTTVDVLRDLAR